MLRSRAVGAAYPHIAQIEWSSFSNDLESKPEYARHCGCNTGIMQTWYLGKLLIHERGDDGAHQDAGHHPRRGERSVRHSQLNHSPEVVRNLLSPLSAGCTAIFFVVGERYFIKGWHGLKQRANRSALLRQAVPDTWAIEPAPRCRRRGPPCCTSSNQKIPTSIWLTFSVGAWIDSTSF
jgi:hypothetical protein